jgi:hypothetical protein
VTPGGVEAWATELCVSGTIVPAAGSDMMIRSSAPVVRRRSVGYRNDRSPTPLARIAFSQVGRYPAYAPMSREPLFMMRSTLMRIGYGRVSMAAQNAASPA